MGNPTSATLKDEFESDKPEEVIEKILKAGTLQPYEVSEQNTA
jgi:ribosome maturation protein Sdo1